MIRNLQALRAIAALMVVYCHLDLLVPALGLRLVGFSGVDLFFVLSGFVMAHTTRRKNPHPLAFFKDRVARIVPIYWLMTLAVFIGSALMPSLFRTTRPVLDDLITSLLFVPHQRANGNLEPILFVGWSLNYEMAFYLLLSLCLMTRSAITSLMLTLGILAAIVTLGAILHPVDPLARFYTSTLLLEFGAGILIGLTQDFLPRNVPRWVLVGALAVMAAMFVVLFGGTLLWPTAGRIVLFLIPASVIVVLAILLDGNGWSWGNRSVMALGDASYVLYLSHPFVTQAAQHVLLHRMPHHVWAAPLVIAPILAAAIAVSLVLHRLVEKPLSAAARRLLGIAHPAPRPAPGA